ncbi:uncharacterized protein K02A2.6-like [Wyeomyia smithii]|uniref:uncharacterized protein K02A2.6-like n=1 Tax=Wyeomyia smithii TaxID=174621 RepID=UPI0024681587|nr:uncharacterized protein K02A2.6-like [Wyeomyia smithii]
MNLRHDSAMIEAGSNSVNVISGRHQKLRKPAVLEFWKSSKLLTINTHRGIYKVNCLTPGVKAAPGAFQQVVDAMLAGLQHTSEYIDDIVVGGLTENTHWEILKALLEHLRESTKNDSVLSTVVQYIHQGWPSKQTVASNPELQQFYNQRESLTIVQGCALFGERLIIPSRLRKRFLGQLHARHPGIGRMKTIARSYVDYAGPLDGDYFLRVVNSFTKWPEIVQTSHITTTATNKILRSLFARMGMPESLISDNGTQFTSAKFGHFCSMNGIEHTTTASFYPQSNGQAERFIDTFKRGIKKIREGEGPIQKALDLFLLKYRSTPNPTVSGGVSPSEALFGRHIRTNLELLRPPADC